MEALRWIGLTWTALGAAAMGLHLYLISAICFAVSTVSWVAVDLWQQSVKSGRAATFKEPHE